MATTFRLSRQQLALMANNDPIVIKAFEDFLAAINSFGAHAANHEPGGSDPLAVDAAAAVGSLRTLGLGAQKAAAGIHAATHVTGGGDVVADAVAGGNAGLLSGADKTKLDTLVPDATKAPLPQAAAGAGQWHKISAGSGVALNLTAGGTWAYLRVVGFVAGSYLVYNSLTADVAAGGTQIYPGVAGYTPYAMEWEILDAEGFDEWQPIYARPDGSFIVACIETGDLYHVLTHEQQAAITAAEQAKNPRKRKFWHHDKLYDRVVAYVAAHPEAVKDEPVPEPEKIDPDQQVASEIMADYIETQKQTKKWQDRKAQLEAEKLNDGTHS